MDKQIPKLYEHQQKALDFIKDKDYFALFMEQGTGKSKVAIEKAYYLHQQGKIDGVIIISPNAIKEQWVIEQFETHYPSNNWKGFIWEGLSTQKSKKEFKEKFYSANDLFVFSVNVEAFQSDSIDLYIKLILSERKVFIIIDESTKIKSGRRKPKRGKRAGAKRTNKVLDYFEDTKYKCILTGTPTPNSPFDLWSQFEFLKYNYFNLDYFFFRYRYGIMVKKDRYSKILDEKSYNIIKYNLNNLEKITAEDIENLSIVHNMKVRDIILIKNMEKYTPYKNLKELKEKITPVTFFVKKKDCLDLPDKVYEKLYCKMGPEQKRLYKELKKNMYTEYNSKELTILNKVVMILRLQMISGGIFPYSDFEIKMDSDGEEYFDTKFKYKEIENNGKIKVLLDDLEEVSKNTFIIIWARFRGEIDLIERNLNSNGYTCEKYYGGSDASVISKFKNKEFQILIANPVKGGEGLNLQHSTLQYFYSNSLRADMKLQAEDRSHRIGQTNKVTYKDLICKGTVDEQIYNVLKRKENLIDYFRNKSMEEFIV